MEGLIDKIKPFLRKNGSTILTCAGALGVIITSVSAVKATPKAMRVLEEAEKEKGEGLTRLEKIKTAGPAYIPSIVIGASTISCIFGANVINKRHQAALVTLYSLLDSTYKEYRAKVKETLGEDTDKRIITAIAKDRYDKQEHTELLEGKQRFMDFYSVHFFDSTMDELEGAVRAVNDILNTRGYVFLGDWHNALGVPCGEGDWEMGWSKTTLYQYGYEHLVFDLERVVREDGDECHIITSPVDPALDFMY